MLCGVVAVGAVVTGDVVVVPDGEDGALGVAGVGVCVCVGVVGTGICPCAGFVVGKGTVCIGACAGGWVVVGGAVGCCEDGGAAGVAGAGRTVTVRGGDPAGTSTSTFAPGCGCLPRMVTSIFPSGVLMRVEPSEFC